MNKSAFILASSLLVISAGAATAGNTRATFGDVSPTHYNELNSRARSASPSVGVSGSNSLATTQKTPTYLLPRELQWMDRPQDTNNGSNR